MKRLFIFAAVLLLAAPLSGQTNEDCYDCHNDPEFIVERNGKDFSVHMQPGIIEKSVHSEHLCIDCHDDASDDHPERLNKVQCGDCHDVAQEKFDAGIHGHALARGDMYAPSCTECHGYHDIKPLDDPESPTYKMNIPMLCGKCHREGAPVARVYNIAEHNILENYTQSIHGEGMFKKGLMVSATCTDCHGDHLILPHTNPKSSISLNNIAGTCMTCHSRIEQVHTQVIRGELWEEEPGAIPACTDCHPPHKVNRQNIVAQISDRSCLRCHAKTDVVKVTDQGDTLSMHVAKQTLATSEHRNIPCVKCHSDVSTELRRPCATAGRVDCSNCHSEIANLYFDSGHGTAYKRMDDRAPYCTDCHGDHDTRSHFDEESPTYRAMIPQLCGSCHKEDGKAAQVEGLSEINAYYDYSQTVHGKGLTEKGLLPSAICTDCHTTHHNLPAEDERSSVHPDNLPGTCASCHRGVFREYETSVHATKNGDRLDAKLPSCADCHSAHGITETEMDQFMTEVTHQCGSCHEEVTETYMETMHGKAYTLGYLESAKCSDCHGAHNILHVNNPASMVGARNIVATCQQCHEDANQRFTGYLTHATHHDKDKYPILFYTYWAMTGLLISVFGFFGVHTLLWFPRAMQGIRDRKRMHEKAKTSGMDRYYIRRFSSSQRMTHIFVIVSFLALALTGMILKFSGMAWARVVADLLGGVQGAGYIHRFAAVITFGYFIFHIFSLFKLKRERRLSFVNMLSGPNSLMFNLQDLKDFWATLKWFFGAGPKPEYGRWTYWEKFDYFAVFWGVAVIGFSGLMLWFPEFFTQFMPGWLINVAQIIHSDEALLAVGFIFTVHFFNTHLRPDAFPMDTVIFTGLIPLEEFKHSRPREYEELKKSGRLRKVVVKQDIAPRYYRAVKIFGSLALAMGITIIILIIYSVLFGYN